MGNDFDPDFTIPQRLLLAARRLEEQGQCPFTAEALIVAAWKDSPRAFGLKGFEESYPDANKTLYSLMGERGLVRKGWFEQLGRKLYRLSEKARAEADRLAAGEPLPPEANGVAKRGCLTAPKLSEDTARRLDRLVHSTALSRHKQRMGSFITRVMADEFTALKPAETVAAARKALVAGVVKVNGGEVSDRQLAELDACRAFVERMFAPKAKALAAGATR